MATNDLNTGLGAQSGEGAGAFSLDASAADPLTLPEGLNPATADFAHEGPDLVMTWPDGSQVTVTDYFMVESQPNLISEGGAKVDSEIASRLAGPVAPGMVADAGAGVAEQPIGQVEKLDGTVTVIRADGTKVELQVGDPVFQGDILETSADGAVGVILADETTFSMAEDGRMVLDEMVFDPGTQEGSVSLSVMQGVFTFVSGQAAKTDPDAMTLHTPVATIGIRGTQVGLDISDGQNLKVALMEEADGFVGEVVIINDGGVSVLNSANEFTVVSNFGLAPTDPIVIDFTDMIGAFAGALRYLPLNMKNANDFGLQSESVQMDMSTDGLIDFEPAAGGSVNADGLADFDVASGTGGNPLDMVTFETAGGGEDTVVEGLGAITVAVDAAASAIAKIEQISPSQSQEIHVTQTNTGGGGNNAGDNTPPPADPTTSIETPGALNADGQWVAQVLPGVPYDGSNIAYDQVINGTTGDDQITTGSGGDTVTGGGGSDVIVGGGGTDTFVADGATTEYTVTTTVDTATNTVTTTVTETSTGASTTLTNVEQIRFDGGDGITPDPVTIVTSGGSVDVALGDAEFAEDGSVNLDLTVTENGTIVDTVTIKGVPEGTLSMGTYDAATGEYTLSAAEVASISPTNPLTFTPAANWSGTLNLEATATPYLGDVSTAYSIVTVTPDALDTTLETGSASGLEDMAITLELSTTVGDATESVTSIDLGGIPEGATLMIGTETIAVSDGVTDITLTQAQWEAITADTPLQVVPPTNDSADFVIKVTAHVLDTADVGTGTETSDLTGLIPVLVAAVADAPTLDLSTEAGIQTVVQMTSVEDQDIPLNIDFSTPDSTVNAESLSVTISGIPNGATLSIGSYSVTDNGNGTFSATYTGVTPDDLAGLKLTPVANFNGQINLGVQVTTTDTDPETNAVSTASTSGTIAIDVTPVDDTPTVKLEDVSGNEDDGGVPLGLDVRGTGGVDVDYIVVTGVPADASLSAGSYDADLGGWKVDAADIATVSILPVEHYSGEIQLGVKAYAVDGSETGVFSQLVTVNAVADAPTLDLSTEAGTQTAVTLTSEEDQAINLNIAVGTPDQDSSEVLNVTLSGIPNGATLTVGTQTITSDGSAIVLENVDPAALAAAQLQPEANYNGPINIGVSVETVDTNPDTGQVSTSAPVTGTINIDVTPVDDTPVVHGTAAAGDEDTAIPLDITVEATGGVAVESIEIKDIPDGAVLMIGTDTIAVSDGVSPITVTAAQLDMITAEAPLQVKPPVNSDEDFALSVTAKAVDGSESEPLTVPVTVAAIADAPTLDTAIGKATQSGGDTIEPSDYSDVQFGAGGGDEDDDEDDGDNEGENNGFGNGDQDAPGGSEDNNNAENAGGDDNDDNEDDHDDEDHDGDRKGGDGKSRDSKDGEHKGGDDDDHDDEHDDDHDDKIEGTDRDDLLVGSDGDDEIDGKDGDDVIIGGAGDDKIEGGEGDDVIFGGSGDDYIEGEKGDDILVGGSGNDTLDGGKGDDILYGGSGNDHLIGGSGDDTAVFGGARSDYLITDMGEGQYVVEHLNGGDDGMNLIEGVESFQFSDGAYGLDEMLSTNPTTDASLTYDITIDSGLTDTDDSESLSDVTISIEGGPIDGVSLTGYEPNADGSWTVPGGELQNLTLNVSEGVSADFSLSVSVTSTEANGVGDTATATTTSTIDVVLPDGWGVDAGISGDTSTDVLDPLAAMFEDSNTLKFEGEEYDISKLTDGDNEDDHMDVQPLGSRSEESGSSHGEHHHHGDGESGYSSSSGSDDNGGYDDNNGCS